MVAPGVWKDYGPESAVSHGGRVRDARPVSNVGGMVPILRGQGWSAAAKGPVRGQVRVLDAEVEGSMRASAGAPGQSPDGAVDEGGAVMTAKFRDDPELGNVRYCPQCRQWWPFDSEFWHMDGDRLNSSYPHRCIACCADYAASRRRLFQQIRRADRAIPQPVDGRCNAPMRGDRCGRKPGHQWAHRSTEALHSDRLRKRGERAAA